MFHPFIPSHLADLLQRSLRRSFIILWLPISVRADYIFWRIPFLKTSIRIRDQQANVALTGAHKALNQQLMFCIKYGSMQRLFWPFKFNGPQQNHEHRNSDIILFETLNPRNTRNHLMPNSDFIHSNTELNSQWIMNACLLINKNANHRCTKQKMWNCTKFPFFSSKTPSNSTEFKCDRDRIEQHKSFKLAAKIESNGSVELNSWRLYVEHLHWIRNHSGVCSTHIEESMEKMKEKWKTINWYCIEDFIESCECDK